MSDVCLDFEDLLVEIKVNYLDNKENISDKLWSAADAAHSKLTKYYVKINSVNFAIATVLDPRYKLDVYDTTQDAVALKKNAKFAIERAFKKYSDQRQNSVVAPQLSTQKRKRGADDNSVSENEKSDEDSGSIKKKRFVNIKSNSENELKRYLSENRSREEDNPLEYWKQNKGRFPILARMARDYLALQPTSKDVEGSFSKGRRTIPYYRRSQNPETIRNQMLVNSGYNLGVFD
jgi:hypothetical protein